MAPIRAGFVLAIGLMTLVSLSGCSASDKTHDVKAEDDRFVPNALSLTQNQQIKVENTGQNLHSVTIHKAGDPITTTKTDKDIAKGTSTTYKFEETGTFHVYCKYHSQGTTGTFSSGMVMTVTVS